MAATKKSPVRFLPAPVTVDETVPMVLGAKPGVTCWMIPPEEREKFNNCPPMVKAISPPLTSEAAYGVVAPVERSTA